MNARTRAEINALANMTPTQLRAKYEELTGEPTRCGNKSYLVRRIAWRLQARDEGGLPERVRRKALEMADDADLRLTPPRGSKSIEEAGEQKCMKPVRSSTDPKPGTVLTRQYKGQTISVLVHHDGYEFEQMRYRSLSAVACEITGSHWNGKLFFGLAPAPGSKKTGGAKA